MGLLNDTLLYYIITGALVGLIFGSLTSPKKKERKERVELWLKTQTLLQDEGSSVELISPNADFNNGPAYLIYCRGEWTGWEQKPFTGNTWQECLERALEERSRYFRGVERESRYHG